MNDQQDDNIFGPVIHSYTRAQAIEDGYLVDVSAVAKEAGFSVEVAISREAYSQFVQWTPEDSQRQVHQDESGRLWDVLTMARNAARIEGSDVIYELLSIRRGGRSQKPRRAQLRMVISAGETSAPVITIMLPNES